MGLYVPLDVAWMDNPKVIRVGLEGAGLHALAMCLAKRTETDGVLHRTQLYRLGATDDLIDHLLAEELLDPVEHGNRPGEDPDKAYAVRVHDWHDRNPSQGAIDAIRDAKTRAGREGNHKRWHAGSFDACEVCNPRSSQGAIGGDSHSETGAIPKEIEKEKENPSVTSADADATAEEFERFWAQYPRRDGKRLEKGKALAIWKRTSRANRDLAMRAVRNYADSGQRAKDAHRWLRDECWNDWQTPATPSATGTPRPKQIEV